MEWGEAADEGSVASSEGSEVVAEQAAGRRGGRRGSCGSWRGRAADEGAADHGGEGRPAGEGAADRGGKDTEDAGDGGARRKGAATAEKPGKVEEQRRRKTLKSGVVLYFHTISPGQNDAPNDNYFGTEGVIRSCMRISLFLIGVETFDLRLSLNTLVTRMAVLPIDMGTVGILPENRSEERRVGKECSW